MGFIIKKSTNGLRSVQMASNNTTQSPLNDIINALKGLTIKVEVKITDVICEGSHNENVKVATSMTAVESAKAAETSSLTSKQQGASNAFRQPSMPSEPVKILAPAKTSATEKMEPIRITQPPNQRQEESISRPTSLSSSKATQPIRAEEKPAKPVSPMSSLNKQLEDSLRVKQPIPVEKPVRSEESTPIDEPTPVEEPKKSALRQPLTFEDRIKMSRPYDEPAYPERRRLGKPPSPSDGPLIRGELKIGAEVVSYCVSVDDRDEPPAAYVAYNTDKLIEIGNLISDLVSDIEGLPEVTTFNIGDIILGKATEDNRWYRCNVEGIYKDHVDVFYFDWGLREKLEKSRTRHLKYPGLGLSKHPACAVKLQFLNDIPELIEEVLSCESAFKMRVETYDVDSEAYKVTLLGIHRP